ncbi:hypothetical protein [Marinimicrobium agarilyticum]|uniref:hypothetical protein n=1 Tax=Marinimicrobium agarilyticum TaxID=306546 RepID=UPI00048371C7|nr:hypothetical protein [Marinimicrobium agarilyticum]
MRIISSSAQALSPTSTQNLKQSEPEDLARGHPIRFLFTHRVLDASHGNLALKLHWRHPDPSSRGAAQAALGCVVDYAARLVARPFLGPCHLSEWELRTYRPSEASTLLVAVQIVAVHRECVTYHCDFHALEKGRSVAMADSQGTLLQGFDT